MYQRDDPTDGHAVLIYANDEAIYDQAGAFKQLGDILWADRNYSRGDVLRIIKKTDDLDDNL